MNTYGVQRWRVQRIYITLAHCELGGIVGDRPKVRRQHAGDVGAESLQLSLEEAGIHKSVQPGNQALRGGRKNALCLSRWPLGNRCIAQSARAGGICAANVKLSCNRTRFGPYLSSNPWCV